LNCSKLLCKTRFEFQVFKYITHDVHQYRVNKVKLQFFFKIKKQKTKDDFDENSLFIENINDTQDRTESYAEISSLESAKSSVSLFLSE
jgi:hypothetical protein